MANAPGYLADYLNGLVGVERAQVAVAGKNNLSALLPKTVQGLARTVAGKGPMRVLSSGDSVTFGAEAGPAPPAASWPVSYRANGYPQRLAELLGKRLGVGYSSQGYLADGGYGTNMPYYNPTVTVGAGWGDSGQVTAGGSIYQNTTTVNEITLTPAGDIDTFEIYTLRASSAGTISYQIDGGAPVNINEAGANGVVKTVVNATLGAHTIKFARVSGTAYAPISVVAYDSSKIGVLVMNAGYSGSRSSAWATSASAWSPTNILGNYAPDLIIHKIGINNWLNSVPVATFKAETQTYITAAKAAADVILLTPNPTLVATTPQATQDQYVNALRELAEENSLILIDNYARSVSWASIVARGWGVNTPHPNELYYADEARTIANLLLAA